MEKVVSNLVKNNSKHYDVSLIVINKEKSNLTKTILDIGTGSGCIAITLSRRLKSKVHGIDISSNAIDVAIKNNSLTDNLVIFKNISMCKNIPKNTENQRQSAKIIKKSQKMKKSFFVALGHRSLNLNSHEFSSYFL